MKMKNSEARVHACVRVDRYLAVQLVSFAATSELRLQCSASVPVPACRLLVLLQGKGRTPWLTVQNSRRLLLLALFFFLFSFQVHISGHAVALLHLLFILVSFYTPASTPSLMPHLLKSSWVASHNRHEVATHTLTHTPPLPGCPPACPSHSSDNATLPLSQKEPPIFRCLDGMASIHSILAPGKSSKNTAGGAIGVQGPLACNISYSPLRTSAY